MLVLLLLERRRLLLESERLVVERERLLLKRRLHEDRYATVETATAETANVEVATAVARDVDADARGADGQCSRSRG